MKTGNKMLKKRKCPECGFVERKSSYDFLQCVDDSGKVVLGTGPVCPFCIISDLKERYPQMEEIEEDDQAND